MSKKKACRYRIKAIERNLEFVWWNRHGGFIKNFLSYSISHLAYKSNALSIKQSQTPQTRNRFHQNQSKKVKKKRLDFYFFFNFLP